VSNVAASCGWWAKQGMSRFIASSDRVMPDYPLILTTIVEILFENLGLEKVGLIKMENIRLLIFMEKPERRNFHFAAVVWGCSVQATNQWPDRINRAPRFI